MSALFYMQDSRSILGNNVVFWLKDGCGYGTNLDKLEVYTLEEAQSQHNSRNSDVPLLKSLVDELSILAVDHQVLPESGTVDKNGQYVIKINGSYNGNDVLFDSFGCHTYEYSNARIILKEEIDEYSTEEITIFSKKAIDNVARRTFQVGNIDRRKMIFKSGIKLAKPKRQRPTTGKARGNCPTCGKITWDYNPYENAYCPNHDETWKRQ